MRNALTLYQTHFQTGPLLETFNTGTNEDSLPVARSSNPRYRAYKITRGDTTSLDYREWPGDLGAPFEDVNGNGLWEAGIDRPRMLGDQQIWCVFNDVKKADRGEYLPMGMEVRLLAYVIDAPAPLDRTIFLSWNVTNRSDAQYDSVRMGMWMDFDLGNANDDYPGCDSLLGFGYVYNALPVDGGVQGYGNAPPAVGMALLKLEPAPPGDSRPMAACTWFLHDEEGWDPIDPWPSSDPLESYDYLRGRWGMYHQDILDPITGNATPYWFSGDPLAGQGFLPSNWRVALPPQDFRVLSSGGPLTLAPGGSCSLHTAFVVAHGGSNLASLDVLKKYVQIVRRYVQTGTLYTGPLLAFEEASLSFPSGRPSHSTDTLRFRVRSQGLEPLVVSSLDLPAAPFEITDVPPLPWIVPVDDSIQFSVVFPRDTLGQFTDVVQIHSNDQLSPVRSVSLSGWTFDPMPADTGVLYGCTRTQLVSVDRTTGHGTIIAPLSRTPEAIAVWGPDPQLIVSCEPWDLGVADSKTGEVFPLLLTPNRVSPPVDIEPSDSSVIVASEYGFALVNASDNWYYGWTNDYGQFRIMGFTSQPETNTLWVSGYLLPDSSQRGIYKIPYQLTPYFLTGLYEFVGPPGIDAHIEDLLLDRDGVLFGSITRVNGRDTSLLARIDQTTGSVIWMGDTGLDPIVSISTYRPMTLAGIDDEKWDGLPSAFALDQNYPNPFNPSTTIRYTLPEKSHVTLTVFNTLGQQVATLVEGEREAGYHEARFGGSQFASGVYLYQFRAGAFVEVRKMMLVK